MNICNYWSPNTPTQHKDDIRKEFALPDGVPESGEQCPMFECVPANPEQKYTYCLECGNPVEMIRIFSDIEQRFPI